MIASVGPLSPRERRAPRAHVLWAFLFAATVAWRPTSAQAGAIAPSVHRPDTATLLVQNRAVFVFRAPLGARTAAERSEAAAQRIRMLAETERRDSVRVSAIPDGLLLSVGQYGVFAITPADVDSIVEPTIERAAANAARRLTDALAAEREQRSIARTFWSIGLSLLATLLFVVLLRGVQRYRRFAVRRIQRAAARRLPALSVRGFTLLTAAQLLTFSRRIVDLTSWMLVVVAAYLWLAYVLTRFPYSAPWGEALGGWVLSTAKGLVLSALGAVPGLFTVVLIVLATRFLSRIVRTLFDGVERGELTLAWLHPDTVQPTRRLVTAALWVFAIVIAYPYLPGSGSDVFKGVSVLIGVMLSLGSSGVVNQAMSGFVLMYARALKSGEYVSVGETEGVVLEVGLLSTKIRTNKREEVTIPNALVVATTTKNFSRSTDDGVLLHASVTIGYDAPWRQVHALLESAAALTQGLRNAPAPFVRQTALSDFYVEYELNAVIEQPHERVAILSALLANIQDCFNAAGVQIMSPHYKADPREPKTVPRDRWFVQARPGTNPGAPASPIALLPVDAASLPGSGSGATDST